jgi:hypothetical protein
MLRFIRFVVPSLLLFLSLSARAEVPIPLDCRIPNQPPGRCGWCAVETLARYLRIEALYGLTSSHPSTAMPNDLRSTLVDKQITFQMQERGERSTVILRQCVEKKLGAVVGFRELYPGSGGHIVTLIDFGADEVRLIDPNDADGRTRTISLERFLHWWDGFALVLEAN